MSQMLTDCIHKLGGTPTTLFMRGKLETCARIPEIRKSFVEGGLHVWIVGCKLQEGALGLHQINLTP